MKIVLVGPNIAQSGTTGFHVHAVGCRDIKQPKYGYAEKEVVEFTTEEALTRYVYSDHIAESADPTNIGAFLADFTYFPCVAKAAKGAA